MPYTVDTKLVEVCEGQAGAALVELAGGDQSAPRRGHLQIEHLRRGQAFASKSMPCAIAIGPVVCEGGHNDARVDDDQRASRSARTADAAA